MALFNTYGGSGYANYQNYQPNNYQPQQIPNIQPTQQNNGIIWVQGEAGAKSYMVAPNSTVQLWDSESQVIYLKSADASGMPSIRILDYTFRDGVQRNNPIFSQDFATKDDIISLRNEIDDLKAKIKPTTRKTLKREVTEDDE